MSESTPAASNGDHSLGNGESAKRGRAPLVVLGVLVLAAVCYGIYAWLSGRGHVTTDDAYVNGNLVRLTPQVSGTVVAINADETQFVKQGQLLVLLDQRDSQVALGQARASLGETVREVAQMYANERRDEATVAAQETQYKQASQDLERDRGLVVVHGVSAQALQHDEHARDAARAALEQARAVLSSSRAATANTTPATHPRVLQAEAALRNAWLAASRAKVVAPVSGYVVRRAVQLGQQVAPGTEMLAIVPVDSMWIDANFKENQLRGLRIGQPVDVEADMYGSHVAYHGKVLGLNPGTGSALAVLPAQNASGNWIKIVQRLPVRIGLDPKELAEHPLFLGLSTNVDVDVHEQNGAALSQTPAWQVGLNTDVYAAQEQGVEDEIKSIVAANLEQAPASPAAGAGK